MDGRRKGIGEALLTWKSHSARSGHAQGFNAAVIGYSLQLVGGFVADVLESDMKADSSARSPMRLGT